MGKSSTVPNADLEHSAGGATTRDPMDAGVPMLPGDPAEPVGPEDALGRGPKRGDYSDRIQSGPPAETVAIPDDERRKEAERLATDGLTADEALREVPMFRTVPQAPHASNRGDVAGKGGVSTEEARSA
jgi:hypothetical protein